MNKISNNPPKGTNDWLPEELKIRQYIFKVWRQVCLSYGYEEYLTPVLESAEIYRAKSGEDVGKKELMVFTDQGGRELALRPEMTPSVTRLVSKIYAEKQKPIKFFSIANFVRNEKPQRGRNREFWQLNYDVFGSESLNADLEIMQMALDIMLAFNPPQGSFQLVVNNRKIIEQVLQLAEIAEEQKIAVLRLLDKREKLAIADFQASLQDLGVSAEGQDFLNKFMSAQNLIDLLKTVPELEGSEAIQEIEYVLTNLEKLGYGQLAVFRPDIIRGFDYYDGLVFEVFDLNPDNKRALFGGGRYNGLASLFGSNNFPAVGCAPGDETLKLFLESWGLLKQVQEEKEDKYYLPILSAELETETKKLARQLRRQGWQIEISFLEQKIAKALEYANKKNIQKVIIFGPEEKQRGEYKVKDMKTGKEEIKKY